jgi:hypothetical protein
MRVILAAQDSDGGQSWSPEGNAVAAVCCCRWMTLNRQDRHAEPEAVI